MDGAYLVWCVLRFYWSLHKVLNNCFLEASRGMVSRGGRVLTNAPAAVTRALSNANMFVSRTVHTMHIPIGPWPTGPTDEETQWIRAIGDMMRTNAFEFIHTLRPMLKSQGFEDEVIDRFMTGAERGEPHLLYRSRVPPLIWFIVSRTKRPLRSYVHALGVRIRRQASSTCRNCRCSNWHGSSIIIRPGFFLFGLLNYFFAASFPFPHKISTHRFEINQPGIT